MYTAHPHRRLYVDERTCNSNRICWYCSLHVENFYCHSFAALDLHKLQAFTELSVKQNAPFHACDVAALDSIAQLSRATPLKRVRVAIGHGAVRVSDDLHWWRTLARIPQLIRFVYFDADEPAFLAPGVTCIAIAGWRLLHAAGIQLESIQLGGSIVTNAFVAAVCDVRFSAALQSISICNAKIGVKALVHVASLPRLAFLEVLHCEKCLDRNDHRCQILARSENFSSESM
jgi:hypothetical protein